MPMRPYRNIPQWTTHPKPIVYLLYFHSRVARIATQNPSVRSEILTLILLRPRPQWVYVRWIHVRCLPDCSRQPWPLHHRFMIVCCLSMGCRGRFSLSMSCVGLTLVHESDGDWLTLVHTLGSDSGSPSNHQARLVPSSRARHAHPHRAARASIVGRGRNLPWCRWQAS